MTPIKNFNTVNSGVPCRLVVQTDGNLVLYNNANTVVWQSGTAGGAPPMPTPPPPPTPRPPLGPIAGSFSSDIQQVFFWFFEKKKFVNFEYIY